MEISLLPLSEVAHLLPLTPQKLQALPDIIDMRIGYVGIALYFYLVSNWHCSWHIKKQPATMNSCTPWFTRYCYEITLPTLFLEFSVL